MEAGLDVFTFRPKDFPHATFAVFEDMRKKEQFCDLRIRVQDHCFTGHRVIIAGVIPYFRTVLTRNEITLETEEIEAEDFDLDPKALESMIDFAYSGEVQISAENVCSLLTASQFLQLNQVRDACVEFLSERLRVDDVIQVRSFGQSLNNLNLITSCDLYIGENFEQFSNRDDFLRLPHSYIKEIISQDALNVASEETVLQAVMNWVKFAPSQRLVVLPELLSEVRMIYLPTHRLMGLVDSEELIRTSIPCRDLIDEVKNYHLSKGETVFLTLKTEPRKSSVRKDAIASMRISSTVKQDMYAVDCNDGNNVSVYCCDFVQKKWNMVANKKPRDSFAFAAATKEKIYMFLTRTILTFHLEAKKWEVLESNHENIKTIDVVFHENVFYCFVQSNSSEVKVCCFDTQQNKWLPEVRHNQNRLCSASVAEGDSIFVTGGYVPGYGFGMHRHLPRTVKAVEKYNPSTERWSESSSMLTPRHSHGCTRLNGKIYVCGGSEYKDGTSVSTETAEVYDPLTNQWNFISSMTTWRSEFFFLSCNNKIYALGGTSHDTRDAEMYDPEKKEWDSSFPMTRLFRSVFSVPSSLNSTGCSMLPDATAQKE